MALEASSRTVRYTGNIHSFLYDTIGTISKAKGHDDPRSPQVGLWMFDPKEVEFEPVLVRRRDWVEAIH